MVTNMRIQYLWAFGAIGIFTLMWILSHTPGMESDFMPAIDFLLRKGAHMTIFMVQYLLLFFWFLPRSLRYLGSQEWVRIHAHTFLWVFFIALLDEWHQSWIPTRSSEPTDVLYNIGGCLCAYMVLYLIWVMRYQEQDQVTK